MALRFKQYSDETGRFAKHQDGHPDAGGLTDEFCLWLRTADLEYFAIASHMCWYVLGPRSGKVDGAVPSFATCFDPGASEKAERACRLLNAEAGTPAPDQLTSGKSLGEIERELRAELTGKVDCR